MKKFSSLAFLILFSCITLNMFSQDSFIPENNSPVLQYPVPVIIADQGEDICFSIAGNTFAELDDFDKIAEYKAYMHTGEELPEWIQFDNESLTFRADTKKTKQGEYFIILEAFDSFSAKTMTEIYFMVK
jgi:hypothetical protein